MHPELRASFAPEAGYLNTASLGIPPSTALEAMAGVLDGWRRGLLHPPDFDDAVNRSRAAWAAMSGVDVSCVATGAAVSQFVGLVAAALPDDARVIAAEGEFTSVTFPFLAHSDRGVRVAEVALDDLARRRPTGRAPFLLALDGVTDPGNVGALLRSAEGAGVSGVVLPRHRAVHVTPAVTKAAAGAVEHLPMALVGGLPSALARLAELGVWVVGLDADAEGSLWDLPVAGEAVAIVLGAEGTGLGRLTRQRCDHVASIPLRGRLGSLNVAAAGALACFEVARRR